MKTSRNGIELIKKFEGCVLKVYLDAVGVPTCGYGHTKGLTRGMVGRAISSAEAEAYLLADLEVFEKRVMKYDSIYHWTQTQFDALVSFAFNIGSIDGLTQNGTRTKSEIADKIPAYCKAGGHVLPGLVERREAERRTFLAGTLEG